MKRILTLLIVSLLLCLLQGGKGQSGPYTPHEAIWINSDNDFTQENGVVGGTGSLEDPYLIRGWEVENISIIGGPSPLISKYFTITNCSITGVLILGGIQINRCTVNHCEFTPRYPYSVLVQGADNITIENCNYDLAIPRGITVTSRNLTLRNCTFHNQPLYEYIAVRPGIASTIINCSFYNSCVGIYSDDNDTISGCTFQNSSDEGIVIRGNHNIVEDCMFLNEAMGIEVSTAQHNTTIRRCSFLHNFEGIASFVQDGANYSCDHVIENCSFDNNTLSAIDLWQTTRVIIRDNIFTNCSWGNMGAVSLRDFDLYPQITSDCEVYRNRFLNNHVAISIEASTSDKVINNVFYDNVFSLNNRDAIQVEQGKLDRQRWNITKTSGKNIVGGYYLGGNYWDDYQGDDGNGDSLGDAPYWINTDQAKDDLPLWDPVPSTTVHLLFGRFQNRTDGDDYIEFTADRITVLSFAPFNVLVYNLNEPIYIMRAYRGFVGKHFIAALCNVYS